MVYIPQPAFSTIMSFMHREHDYARQQVVDQLAERCANLGDNTQYIPLRLLQRECMFKHVANKYRSYHNKMSVCKCTCGYCRAGLWGIC